MNIGEDSSDSWDTEGVEVKVELVQMGADVMKYDYESEELLSLDESSSNGDHGDDDNP